ncbi:MAG: pilus assembly PilX N-terminal domain-containing protein [Patescibacteria group bacterium]|nr:hypothetical protein [Patescibacteria group bacterium]MDE1944189.1 pilus assembly PilX N-terminal domain-containing protein [Patescibacteria group bacterium]MDE1945310.1 pilus assembly PilX N-terminal domain-containing protein [Patescibacteria group bacterium]MDE2057580.1 pilus assembly PilX N-terminal domain-containing protein [Patescibacteria group bacterium]
MAMNPRRGIALLVTVIFMAVMVSFGLALASLAYKQSVLASDATLSQDAFYAADAALECALYADQQEGAYVYSDYSAANEPNPGTIAGYAAAACDGSVSGSPSASWTAGASGALTVTERIALNGGASCADVTIYKYLNPLSDGHRAFIFAEGYNTSCAAITAGGRVVSRGIYEKY